MASFTCVTPIAATASAAHPTILVDAHNRVFLAWKEYDGNKTDVLFRGSADAAAGWGAAATLATTSGASDHPFLIKGTHGIFLYWQTEQEGFRLISLEGVREAR